MAISALTAAGVIVIAAGSGVLCASWINGSTSGGLATSSAPTAADCTQLHSAGTLTPDRSRDLGAACMAAMAARYPNASWAMLARSVPR